MRIILLPVLLTTTTTALAQGTAAGQPDNAALLRAIEGLSGRLKSIEDRLGRVEAKDRAAGQPPIKPGAAGSGRLVTDQAAAQAVPGWFVKLIPWTPDQSGASVGGFPGPVSNFDFNLHTRYFPGKTRFIYQGESVFHPSEDGEYTFVVTIEPVAVKEATFFSIGFNCRTELKANGNTVVQGATAMAEPGQIQGDLYRPQYFSGSLRLTPEAGKGYVLTFQSDCWAERNKTATWYESYLEGWKKNRFRINVKTPADMHARPFRNEELFYLGRS